jgi:hypothetical protein
MRTALKVSVVLLFAVLASRVRAADAPPSADTRCLVISALMVSSDDAKQRTAGTMAMLYWVGRLDAFTSKQIEDAMASESDMTPLQFQSEAARCGETLQVKGAMMQEIGKNLIRRSKDQQDSKPTA